MAYRIQMPAPFTCSICGLAQDTSKMGNWQAPIAPLCRGCEAGGIWATGYHVRYRYTPERHPDRRILSQIRALADQLHHEAIRVRVK